jgi:hypothetical protein
VTKAARKWLSDSQEEVSDCQSAWDCHRAASGVVSEAFHHLRPKPGPINRKTRLYDVDVALSLHSSTACAEGHLVSLKSCEPSRRHLSGSMGWKVKNTDGCRPYLKALLVLRA